MNDSDSRALSPQPTSRCMRYQPLLTLLRTDALSPREAATLTEHLSSCPWCQREVATYDALDAAARQHLSTVSFTPLTLEDIMQAMQNTQTPTPASANDAPAPMRGERQHTARRRPSGPSGPSGRPPISILGSLAAVIALILLTGLIFMTHGSGTIFGSGTPMPTATPPSVSQQSAALAQSTWILQSLSIDGHEQPIVPSHAPTLRFRPQDDRSGGFEGRSGCNNYSGTYTLADTTLHMSQSGTTNMLCTSDVMDEEQAYLNALPRVTQFLLAGDTLTLSSGGGSVQLAFHAIHATTLAQSAWTLTQLIIDGHEQPLAPSHAPMLRFQPKDDLSGVVQGTGGCNSFSGSYTLTDTALHMSISMITLVACQSIVSTPEQAYLNALPRVARYNLNGDTLILANADGSVQLTFHATR